VSEKMDGLLDPNKFDPDAAAQADREERAGMEQLDAEARGTEARQVTRLEYDEHGRIVKIIEEVEP
jgi:hypothetical protein